MKALLPEIVSMENVPELRRHGIFEGFISTLNGAGYHVSHQEAYCPDYGIPQPVSYTHLDVYKRQVLANPPFNDSDWFRKDDDVRWRYGVPPKGNAGFAWVLHLSLIHI